jgi:hypothetical protein
MLQFPSIVTFTLHIDDINKSDNDRGNFQNEYICSLEFGDKMEDVILER